MINARAIATLGIGFGVVAIATLGILSGEVPQREIAQEYGASFPSTSLHRTVKPPTPKQDVVFTADDQMIITFVVNFVLNQERYHG